MRQVCGVSMCEWTDGFYGVEIHVCVCVIIYNLYNNHLLSYYFVPGTLLIVYNHTFNIYFLGLQNHCRQ